MCGLFGLAGGSLNAAEINDLWDLGMISSLRGKDSTGLMMAGYKNEKSTKVKLLYHKELGNPGQVMYKPEVWSKVVKLQPFIIAGHCRWATLGAVTYENAHPFSYKNILGMHNGTAPTFAPAKSQEGTYTDSRLIFESLADKGLKDTLVKIDDGAFALVWFNSFDRTLNFIRNEKRELWFVRNSDNVLMWASDRNFLEMIDRKSYIKYLHPSILKPYVHYKMSMGLSGMTETDMSECKPASKTSFTSGHWSGMSYGMSGCAWNDWDPNDDSNMRWVAEQKEKETKTDSALAETLESDAKIKAFLDKAGPIVQDYPVLPTSSSNPTPASRVITIGAKLSQPLYRTAKYFGWKGEEIPLSRAFIALGKGCSGCMSKLEPKDEHMWFSNTEFLCGECTDSAFHQDYTLHRVSNPGQLVQQPEAYRPMTAEEAEESITEIRCG